MRSNSTFSKRLEAAKDRSYHWVRGLDSVKACFDDRALAVFQADILTSDQYLATYKRKINLDPERALMFAVLQDAVVCFQECIGAHNKRKRRLFREAEEWILNADNFYLFSFENVCASLGFDANYLRRGLMAWKTKTLGLSYRRLAKLATDRLVEQGFGNKVTDRSINRKQFVNVQLLRAPGADSGSHTKFSEYKPSRGRPSTLSKDS
jgi:hypothetical protein